MRYQIIDSPAENINALLDYLRTNENRGRYIYRGQVTDWPGPLIPSLYRKSIAMGRIFTNTDREYAMAMRNCGKRFIQMEPDSYIRRITRGFADLTREQYDSMAWLAANLDFSILCETHGWDAAISRFIHPSKRQEVQQHTTRWRAIVEELQRARICQYGFRESFGYMLGTTLAQQYGFSSEFLDFTSDLSVAGFFATHAAPHYSFAGASLCATIGSDVGVIYRVPSTEGEIRYGRFNDYSYYSCPSQLHMSDLCMRFEDKSSPDMDAQWFSRVPPEGHAMMLNATPILPYYQASLVKEEMRARGLPLTDAVDRYLHLYYTGGGIRYYRLLEMPPGAFADSRLGRQHAVLVVLDELRKETKPDGGENVATFQAVEDVSFREGCERFFFRHTDYTLADRRINREFLWPREGDPFKVLVSRLLHPTTEPYHCDGMAIPKRVSLVSDGFQP